MIKKFPKTKSLGPDGCTGKFCQTFREKSIPLLMKLFKLFQKVEEEGTLPGTFYKATIALIQIPNNDTTKKERKLQANITGEHTCENMQENITKPKPTIY